MTLKGFLRAALRAFLAFAIYFGWQIIVVNWAYIAATFVVMPGIDPSVLTGTDYDSMLIEFQNKAAEIVMNYSMHLTLVSGVLAALTFIIIAKARRRKFLDDLGVKKLPANLIPVLILSRRVVNIFVSLALKPHTVPAEWIDSVYRERFTAVRRRTHCFDDSHSNHRADSRGDDLPRVYVQGTEDRNAYVRGDAHFILGVRTCAR